VLHPTASVARDDARGTSSGANLVKNAGGATTLMTVLAIKNEVRRATGQ
jgi:hypothetical protein